jgi:hypothetical protein
MSGKPAFVRKREAANVIKAAQQQGATKVEISWGSAKAVVHLSKSDEADNASLDKNEWDGAV